MYPKFFFCSNCGAIHEINWNDLKQEQWAQVMMFIKENNPDSKELAEKFNFSRRMAQVYLKEFKGLSASVIKPSFYTGERKP